MSEKKSIKELSEFIDGVEAIGVPVAKTFADGNVNALDLPNALELINNSDKIIAGANGVSEIPGEVLDIDGEEAIIVVQKLYAVISKIKAASKAS